MYTPSNIFSFRSPLSKDPSEESHDLLAPVDFTQYDLSSLDSVYACLEALFVKLPPHIRRTRVQENFYEWMKTHNEFGEPLDLDVFLPLEDEEPIHTSQDIPSHRFRGKFSKPYSIEYRGHKTIGVIAK